MARNQVTVSSKAEVVRQRRKQQNKKRTERKVQRAQEMPVVQNTPIFVRRGVVGTPVVHRTRTNVKRKIALPLQSGSEMVIPGLPIIRFGWRFLSGFISITLLVFLILIHVSAVFNINEVSVNGLKRVKSADVSSVLNLKGKPIYAADPHAILNKLEEAFPELYDIEVAVAFPASLEIIVTEREPVITWQYENLSLWIDSEGVIFPARGSVEDLIKIQSNTAPPRLQVPMTEEEIEAAKAASDDEEDEDAYLKDGPVDPEFIQEILNLRQKMPQASQLSYRDSDGFGWHDDEHNWNVYFGRRLNNLDQKLLLYEHIKNHVLNNGLQPDLISVAFIRAPFYRLEQ